MKVVCGMLLLLVFENATAKGECRFERVLSNGFLLCYVGCSTGFIFDEWILFLNKC